MSLKYVSIASGIARVRISTTGTLVMVTILTIVGHGWSIGAIHQKTARVAGTVFDPSGAVVVNAKVSVRGSSFEKETATNEEGQYQLELPPGMYSIEVRRMGFCLARRASFKSRPQIKVKFDFTLLVCPSHGEGPMRYESFALKSDPSEPPDFLIRFGKRIDKQDTIEFEGALTEIAYYDSDTKVTDRSQNYVNVAVTYDGWTISAKHLTLNKRTLRLGVEEDVVISDGTRETKGTRAEIDFSLTNPVVNVKN